MNADAIPAGAFDTWLGTMQAALDGRGEMDVPCGDCNACCRAAYFIQIEADETQALAAIAEPLLFPAPGDSSGNNSGNNSGNKVMGFNESNQCPMLQHDSCTIYSARPRTCRVFDCRLFAATGIFPQEPAKAEVSARARRWRFSHANQESAQLAAATQAAGNFLRDNSTALQDVLPRNATQLAVLAVRIHDLFVDNVSDDSPRLTERIRARINP